MSDLSTHRLSVLISDTERSVLQELAKECSVSVSEWVRLAIAHGNAMMPSPLTAEPPGLDEKGRLARRIIGAFSKRHQLADDAYFYSPAQWTLRGEAFGTDSKLIVVYDGSEFASLYNTHYKAEALLEKLQQQLEKHGMFIEQCTVWYSVVDEFDVTAAVHKQKTSTKNKSRTRSPK